MGHADSSLLTGSPSRQASREIRPPLDLPELLELVMGQNGLDESQCGEIESRTLTLRSQVLKEKTGSVRSQAAARYTVSPAEIIAELSRRPEKDCSRLCVLPCSLLPHGRERPDLPGTT